MNYQQSAAINGPLTQKHSDVNSSVSCISWSLRNVQPPISSKNSQTASTMWSLEVVMPLLLIKADRMWVVLHNITRLELSKPKTALDMQYRQTMLRWIPCKYRKKCLAIIEETQSRIMKTSWFSALKIARVISSSKAQLTSWAKWLHLKRSSHQVGYKACTLEASHLYLINHLAMWLYLNLLSSSNKILLKLLSLNQQVLLAQGKTPKSRQQHKQTSLMLIINHQLQYQYYQLSKALGLKRAQSLLHRYKAL